MSCVMLHHVNWYIVPDPKNEGPTIFQGDRGSTVVKVLCYKSEGRWFDSSWCQWIFYLHKILPIALWNWGRLSL